MEIRKVVEKKVKIIKLTLVKRQRTQFGKKKRLNVDP